MKNFKNLKYIDNIEDLYNINESIGKGSFGKVCRAKRKGTNMDCAIKIILKNLDKKPTYVSLKIEFMLIL